MITVQCPGQWHRDGAEPPGPRPGPGPPHGHRDGPGPWLAGQPQASLRVRRPQRLRARIMMISTAVVRFSVITEYKIVPSPAVPR